jgi:hypothetical protein
MPDLKDSSKVVPALRALAYLLRTVGSNVVALCATAGIVRDCISPALTRCDNTDARRTTGRMCSVSNVRGMSLV